MPPSSIPPPKRDSATTAEGDEVRTSPRWTWDLAAPRRCPKVTLAAKVAARRHPRMKTPKLASRRWNSKILAPNLASRCCQPKTMAAKVAAATLVAACPWHSKGRGPKLPNDPNECCWRLPKNTTSPQRATEPARICKRGRWCTYNPKEGMHPKEEPNPKEREYPKEAHAQEKTLVAGPAACPGTAVHVLSAPSSTRCSASPLRLEPKQLRYECTVQYAMHGLLKKYYGCNTRLGRRILCS